MKDNVSVAILLLVFLKEQDSIGRQKYRLVRGFGERTADQYKRIQRPCTPA
jgi:hypothetical protein